CSFRRTLYAFFFYCYRDLPYLHSFPTRRSSDLFHNLALAIIDEQHRFGVQQRLALRKKGVDGRYSPHQLIMTATPIPRTLAMSRSEEHTSELQSRFDLVCRLLLEKKKETKRLQL